MNIIGELNLFQIIIPLFLVFWAAKILFASKNTSTLKIIYELRWVAIALVGAVVILYPISTARISNVFGVRYGTNFVMYLALIWVMIQINSIYTKINNIEYKLYELVNKVPLKNEPLVSVAMPAYNSEKYIIEAIESILYQTYTNIELIIVDDCSTDNTLKIIEEYAQKDDRIKLLKNKENKGNYKTRNRAMKQAEGKYIALLDSDDIAKPYRIREQVEFMERNPDIGACSGHVAIANEKGRVLYIRKNPLTDEDIKRHVLRRNTFSSGGAMAKRVIFEELGYFNETDFKSAGDFDFWLRLGSKYKMGNLDKVVITYRTYPSSVSKRKISQTEKTVLKLRWKAYKELGYKASLADWIFNSFQVVGVILIPDRFKLRLFEFIDDVVFNKLA